MDQILFCVTCYQVYDTETKITFRDANNIKYSVYTTEDVRSKYITGADITVYSDDEVNYELLKRAVTD